MFDQGPEPSVGMDDIWPTFDPVVNSLEEHIPIEGMEKSHVRLPDDPTREVSTLSGTFYYPGFGRY